MLDPQFLFWDPKGLHLLPCKQPDLSKPENRRKGRGSLEKNGSYTAAQRIISYFIALVRLRRDTGHLTCVERMDLSTIQLRRQHGTSVNRIAGKPRA